MKKLNIKKSFKSNNFKYGGYSTLVTVLVLAILIAVNVVAGKLNIKKDLTQNKLYSLSDESYKIINDLKSDVKIYAFFESGSEDKNVEAVLDKYKAASKKIAVEYKDPLKNPEITQKYSTSQQEVSSNSIVVESGSKFKVIDYYDLFDITYDESGNASASTFKGEQQITNAIVYVTSNTQQTLYTLSGHEEKDFSDTIANQLQTENYSVKSINLMEKDAKLDKGSLLAIVSPTRDISKDEEKKIKDFLNAGGRAAFFMDITKEVLPNFQDLLSSYGVKLQNALVIEGQTDMIVNQPIDLLPEMQSHDILNSLKDSKLPVCIPVAQGISEVGLKRSTLTIEPLLKTSSNSWAKVNLNATTMVKEANDIQGPINVAVAITDDNQTSGVTSKLVVVGGTTFMEDSVNSVTKGANLDFVMNSFNWLQDKKDSVTIRPRDLTSSTIMMSTLQKLLLSGVVVILIPAVVMIIGITVWVRRRHR